MRPCHISSFLQPAKYTLFALIALPVISVLSTTSLTAQQSVPINSPAQISLTFESLHSWRPPFALERVGNSQEIVVVIPAATSNTQYRLTTYSEGNEVANELLNLKRQSPDTIRRLIKYPEDQIVISEKTSSGWTEVARKKPSLPVFECDAVAKPKEIIHPVDLGTILVPANWLLLESGQEANVEIAVISREKQNQNAVVKAWYASKPQQITRHKISLPYKRKIQESVALPPAPSGKETDVLHIVLSTPGSKEIWKKTVDVMLVEKKNSWPSFGAVKTRLRYDMPIINIVNGKNQPINYDSAWSADKDDYVVLLPNGSRWVFWRGSSYIPVWVSRYNTGLSYEWAERIAPNDGFTDCPEPLMDKELRYGSVEIVESTAARVHVRWSYQSCDFNYKVNGDFAHEDYYFYPDGLGTRVLTLTSLPQAEYEVAEFILLAPPAALPFEVLPPDPMEIISYKTGTSAVLTLPESDTTWKTLRDPIIYRMKLHTKEPYSAFSFNPLLDKKPVPFSPFKDKGLIVTPAYWGGHWPLSQGFNTGRVINESIWTGPSHNSLITWGPKRPNPARSRTMQMRDALGVIKQMKEETWVWLIGMTDEPNDKLLQAAKSFAEPPTITLTGGRQEPDGYASERRAMKIIAEGKKLVISIQPRSWCVNPVFEIRDGASVIKNIQLGKIKLTDKDYSWDGKNLWVNSRFQEKKLLEIEFAD